MQSVPAGPYLTGNDRTVRRQAWKAYSDYFMTVADELDDIYDKLVKTALRSKGDGL